MTQKLAVYQALWAMERRHTDGFERTLEDNIALIAQAGFDGVTASYASREQVARLSGLIKPLGMGVEGQCFPRTIDELQPVLETAAEFGVTHINIQPDVRPRCLADCLALVDGWARLAEQVEFPVYIETHRDRMTTDLYLMLDLLDERPEMRLVGDLSHYLVGREFAWPVSDENHALIHRVLEHCWAFHGRVASREQVQIEISFEPHRPWVELFLDWWRYGFASWRRRAGPHEALSFTCELGPKPYAIIGRDGNDTTDRWAESLTLAGLARDLWAETTAG